MVETRQIVQAMAWTLLGYVWIGGGVPGWAQGTGAALPPLAMAAAAPTETKVFPLAEIHRGLRGVAYTVFEGVVPEPMEVEILGLLKNSIGPGQDLILARLHGTKPEYTGVVAGMSGSPVYIDGKLVGALSYRIGQFSKEAIAGITPIEQMLEVRDGAIPVGGGVGQKQILRSAQDDNFRGKVSGGGDMQAIETPLVFGGFSQETVERFGDRFRAMGLTPVAGLGGEDKDAVQPEPLVPGSAVSAVLVRGDLSMAGTCTVTYIDPKRLLACGHPITQYGQVDMPMTKANVVATLASPLNAFKIINTTETVGAFTEDRASAIMGQFGVKARMIPVAVEVVPAVLGSSGGGKTKTFHFEVLDNKGLTPSSMLVSIYQSLQGTNQAAVEMSYRLTGELGVEGQAPVKLAGLMTQNDFFPASINSALYVFDRFGKVYGNAVDQPVLTGLELRVEAIAERRSAVLETARLSKPEARAGETVEVEATIRPFHAEAQVVRIAVKLPDVLAPGPVRVVVSDASLLDRLTGTATNVTASQRALGLADTVAQLNRLHTNDRLYVAVLDHTAQAVLDGESLPGVPISMANVLGPLKESQRMQLTGESVVEVGSGATGYAMSGSQVLTVTIR